jgi:hypothetical protein
MKYVVIAIALPVALILVAYTYFSRPIVFSARSAKGVIIHCEVLHDYPSDVGRIEIIEEKSGQTVWLVKARNDELKLHSFELTRGRNAGTLQPSDGQFQVVIPEQGSFYLKPGVSYRTSVCSSGWFSVCRTATFSP